MTFAIIGLGKEGFALGKEIVKHGHKIVGIDLDFEVTRRAKEFFSSVWKLDATKKIDLNKLPLSSIDYIVILIKNEKANLLSSLLLKDLGCKEIWTCYTSPLQQAALESININVMTEGDCGDSKGLFNKIYSHLPQVE